MNENSVWLKLNFQRSQPREVIAFASFCCRRSSLCWSTGCRCGHGCACVCVCARACKMQPGYFSPVKPPVPIWSISSRTATARAGRKVIFMCTAVAKSSNSIFRKSAERVLLRSVLLTAGPAELPTSARFGAGMFPLAQTSYFAALLGKRTTEAGSHNSKAIVTGPVYTGSEGAPGPY